MEVLQALKSKTISIEERSQLQWVEEKNHLLLK